MKRIGLVMLAASFACTYAKLSTPAERVQMVIETPPASCKNLGPVIGEGGGGGGGFVANSTLVEYALNDARNKAAAIGATHLQASAPQLGRNLSATVMAIAFRCNG